MFLRDEKGILFPKRILSTNIYPSNILVFGVICLLIILWR